MNVTALLLADSRFPGGGHAHSGGLEEAAARGLIRTEEDLPAFLRGRLMTAGLLAATFAAAAAHLAARGFTDWSKVDEELDARTPSAAQRAASRAQGKATARAATAQRAEGRLHHIGTPPAAPAGPAHSAAAPAFAAPASATAPVASAAPAVPGAAATSVVPPSATAPAGSVVSAAAAVPASVAAPRPVAEDSLAALLATLRRPHHPVILGALVGVGGGSPADAATTAAYLAISGPASASVRLLGLDPLRVNAMVAALAGTVEAVAEQAAATARLEPADLPAPGSPGLDLLAEEHDRHHREEVRLFVS